MPRPRLAKAIGKAVKRIAPLSSMATVRRAGCQAAAEKSTRHEVQPPSHTLG